jgi:hypothetical protein
MNEDRKSITPGDDLRGRTMQAFATRHGVSVSLIQRGVSWGLIRVLQFGDRPIIPAEEHERICREGLPRIPPGYKRKTTGTWPGGRPRKKNTETDVPVQQRRKGRAAVKAGKANAAAGKVTPPRRSKRGEDRARP